MKRLLFIICVCSFFSAKAFFSDTLKLYNPNANAEADIKAAIAKAKQEHKHVLIQAGGNWCSWCLLFNKFTKEDRQLDSAINATYIVYHLNYSQENKNKPVFEKFGFPQRFGFPVFIILDSDGNRIHTQNSSYLEEGKGYNKRKVLEFFHDWAPDALNASNYKNY
jgi:thioredoxin-related protein